MDLKLFRDNSHVNNVQKYDSCTQENTKYCRYQCQNSYSLFSKPIETPFTDHMKDMQC
jgi:hypothetical protein